MLLNRNQIGDTGAQALAASKHRERLKELNLRENLIGEAGLRALLASPLAHRLNEDLDLEHNEVSAETLAALRKGEHGRREPPPA